MQTQNFFQGSATAAAIALGGRAAPGPRAAYFFPKPTALDHVCGYTPGSDMTWRDLQRAKGDVIEMHVDKLPNLSVRIV